MQDASGSVAAIGLVLPPKTSTASGLSVRNRNGRSELRQLFVLLSAVTLAEVLPAETNVAERIQPKALKILMIGNSFSISVGTHMPKIAKTMGLQLELGSLCIGGCSLQKHWANWVASTNAAFKPYAFDLHVDGKKVCHDKMNIPEALARTDWDIVTFQQQSALSMNPASFHPYAEKLQAAIRERLPNAEFVWQETWSYLPWHPSLRGGKIDQNEMYARLHKAYADIAARNNQRIIPTGTAIQLYRQKLPVKYTENSLGGDVCGANSAFKKKDDGTFVYKGDTIHLNVHGQYLQALVWTAKLFGVDVRTCAYASKGLAPEKAALMRDVAMEAVGDVSQEGNTSRIEN